jgi:protein SCO1/2
VSGPDAPVTETSNTGKNGDKNVAKGPLWRNPWFMAFVLGAVFITLIRPLTRHEPEAPKVKFELPAFSLTDQSGQAFGSEQLKGKIHVVSFFFTSCVTICPKVMKAMAQLQEKYQRNDLPVQLVSITVDPDNDTPQKLKEYGQKVGADFSRWRFLTGTWDQVNDLIVKGFKTHMGRAEEGEEDDQEMMDIGHGAHLILVDDASGVLGIYDTTDDGIDEIYHRSSHVLRDIRQRNSCTVVRRLR